MNTMSFSTNIVNNIYSCCDIISPLISDKKLIFLVNPLSYMHVFRMISLEKENLEIFHFLIKGI